VNFFLWTAAAFSFYFKVWLKRLDSCGFLWKNWPTFHAEVPVKISYSLLSRFVDLADVSPAQLAERLTLSGLEVSGLEDHTQALDKVVVGVLRSVKPHPNADKLSLTEVDVPGATLHVVCGAKNIAPGDKVPVALDGAVLPGNLKIKRSKIRGEESEGMLCSERELGLSADAAGIMHFPPETPIGVPVASLLAREALLEVEVTPNRADCLSHLGVARQVAAVFGRPLSLPAIDIREQEPAAVETISAAIEPDCGCGRYCARVITGVKIGPSPAWLQQALTQLGQRSINNIVDVTNYVMLEFGQPLHAFDLARLHGAKVQARLARPGETLVTLDGEPRKLAGGELVIADADRPVALAGVMGGRDTEVTDATTSILLEAAWFDSRAVRRTARGLGAASESSYRFERGVDPEIGLTLGLDRAAQLMAETAGGSVLRGLVDLYPGRKPPVQVALRLAKAEKILGLALNAGQATAALERLGFLVEPGQAPNEYQVRVPSFRQDVTLEENLIEDIAQALGYDKIPVTPPCVTLASPAPDARREFLRASRALVAGLGVNEVITYSFLDPADFEKLRLPPDHPWRTAVAIKNPLSVETSLLRTSLLPGLIAAAAYNLRRGRERVFLFESGAVFLPEPGRQLPLEPQHLGLVLTGPRYALDWRQGQKRPAVDFYDVKGILENLLARLQLQPAAGFRFESADLPFLHPRLGFRLVAPDGRQAGWAGALHPETLEQYKLKETVVAAEVDLEILFAFHSARGGVKTFSRFPASVRDLALAVPEETQAGDVMRAIRQAGGPMLAEVTPFDVYRGEGLPPGSKSLAFSLTFQAEDRTLQEEDLTALQERILAKLQDAFQAKQR
jgi:phenylalanyl-tRNA synthetase beta chain